MFNMYWTVQIERQKESSEKKSSNMLSHLPLTPSPLLF